MDLGSELLINSETPHPKKRVEAVLGSIAYNMESHKAYTLLLWDPGP